MYSFEDLSREELVSALFEVVRLEIRRAVAEVQAMKPLMKEEDVIATLGVGRTTFVNKIQPKLPPLWVEGQKRWHPDAVDAYLRSIAGRRRRR